MENIIINLSLFGSGLAAGLFIGYTLGKMEKKNTPSKKIAKSETFYITRQCEIYLKHSSSILSRMREIKVFYKKDKIITNDCQSLIGEKCKHTNEKCIFV